MRIQVYHTDSHPDSAAMVEHGGRVEESDAKGRPTGNVLSDEPVRSEPARASQSREGPTSFSFAVGRILDQPHPATGELISKAEIADALEARAREMYPPPHYRVEREELEQRQGDALLDPETGEQRVHPETGEPLLDTVGVWVPVGTAQTPAPAGDVHERAIETQVGTEASAE